MRALYAVVGLAAVATSYFGWEYFATGRPVVAVPTEFQSGPQVGSKLPGPFEPLNVNGPDAGDEACLYCRYGNDPVVMIFANKPTEQLASLVRQVEKGTAEAAKSGKVGACVIVTDATESTKAALTKLADRENLKHVLLAMIEARKLKRYELNPEAEITVLLYSKQVVQVNHAFKTAELTDKTIDEVSAETAKFLAAK